MSSVAPGSLTSPSQTGRAPAARPAVEGCTTMTFAWSHTSRQSETRTGTSARNRAVCAAWSPVTLGLPQQQSRHTTTRQGTVASAVCSVRLPGIPRRSPPGEIRPGVV
ncbi:hypothetical protein ADL04_02320 [Streptomyces sp. NRRL B-3648]|nr:hypothetical protein ADL04_02320 [Streptomyces sp. NRRL B-3648]